MSIKLFLIFACALLGKPSSAQNVACEFTVSTIGYECNIVNQTITNENDLNNVVGVHLPGYSDINVTWLDSTRSTIQVFPSLLVDRFVNLEWIWLQFAGIREFRSPITNCDKLGYVFIDSNAIQTIPEGIFSRCQGLLVISLSFNQLSSIHDNAFVGLSNLSSLGITNNTIRTLPPAIFAHTPLLRTLIVTNNEIDELSPALFLNLPNLRTLSAGGNRISSWNPTILQSNRDLTTLELENNRIQNIDSQTFGNLPILTTLSVGSQIEQLPVFTNLLNLTTLNLSNNILRNISAGPFANLGSLTTLNLNNNEIDRIEFTMSNTRLLPNLRTLNLNSNNISTIQENAFNMLSLEVLNLGWNRLERLNASSFQPMRQMQLLTVTSNRINRIERGLFADVEFLEFRASGNVCFNANVNITADFDTRIPRLADCFSFAVINKASLMLLIVSAIFAYVLKL